MTYHLDLVAEELHRLPARRICRGRNMNSRRDSCFPPGLYIQKNRNISTSRFPEVRSPVEGWGRGDDMTYHLDLVAGNFIGWRRICRGRNIMIAHGCFPYGSVYSQNRNIISISSEVRPLKDGDGGDDCAFIWTLSPRNFTGSARYAVGEI